MRLQIEKLVYGGDGLARMPADGNGPGKAAFVPFVIPGEQIEASPVETRRGFVRARTERVLAASGERVDPACPYFQRCGGCHYQHINYDAQLRYKAEILQETLRRTAKFDFGRNIQVHASEPWSYRNRSRVRTRHVPDFALGYNRFNSHDLLPVEICPISSPLINQAIAAMRKLGGKGTVPRALHGLQFFSNGDNTTLLVEAYVSKDGTASQRVTSSTRDPGSRGLSSVPAEFQRFAEALHGELPQAAGVVVLSMPPIEDESRQPTSDTMFSEVLHVVGERALLYHAAGHDYRVSGGSFFQTNRFLTNTLIEVVLNGRKGCGAIDLYAGVGLFTAQLARNFDTVLAVEFSPHAFADLRQNVPSNVKCIRSTTEEFLAERGAKLAPDLVVVDPPRAGLGEKTARVLGRMTVPHVTYVSCDPATLARDLRVLLEFNFRVEQVHLVDMFPQTFHLETVVHLAH